MLTHSVIGNLLTQQIMQSLNSQNQAKRWERLLKAQKDQFKLIVSYLSGKTGCGNFLCVEMYLLL